MMDTSENEIFQNILTIAESLQMTKPEMTMANDIGDEIRENIMETIKQLTVEYSYTHERAAAILILALSAETMGLTVARAKGISGV